MTRSYAGHKYTDNRPRRSDKTDPCLAQGLVTLSGKFFKSHKEEIMHLVCNAINLSEERTHVDKILKITDQGDSVRLETTSDSLAIHIGKVLEHAYKGKKEIKFRRGDKFAMVDWSRD